MRRNLTLIPCLAFMASLSCAAKADPIPGTITLTVEPSGSLLTGVPYVYSSSISDMNNPPPFVYMFGSILGYPGPDFVVPSQINIQTNFNMTITFDGAASSHPSIDLAGPVSGSLDVTAIPRGSPLWLEGFNLSSSLNVRATPTSATLQGWTPDSGVPMSLISQYLNPSSDTFTQTGSGIAMASAPELGGGSFLAINLSAEAPVPEPATVLVYLTAIAGLGVRRGARLWPSYTAR